MTDTDDFTFIQNMLLSSLRIHSTIFNCSYEQIHFFDYGLRQNIWGENGYTPFITHYLPSIQEQTIYMMKDAFFSHYAFLRLPALENQFLSIGPYLLEDVNDTFFMKVITQNKLHQNIIPALQNYYARVPLVDSSVIISTINTLATFMFKSASNYKISFMNDSFEINEPTFDFIPEPEMSLAMQVLESRYATENSLMEAVAKGDRRDAMKFFHEFSTMKPPLTGIEPLDALKNQAIVLNTLCRKAAESSFVHPIYLDELSSTFAQKINQTNRVALFEELYLEIVRKYCVIVQNHSLKQYSPIIRRAIHSIHFHLSLPLSLSSVAKELCVHPNYLSTLFTKELQMTFTEYVHQERIQVAIKLLNTTDMQIQNIAWYVGFTDVNYFTKLFKKHKGCTPSHYRKKLLTANLNG